MATMLGLAFSRGMVAIAPFLRESQQVILGVCATMSSVLVWSAARQDGHHAVVRLAVVSALCGLGAIFIPDPSGTVAGVAVLVSAAVPMLLLLARRRIQRSF